MTSVANAGPGPSLATMIFGDGTPRRAFATALVVGTILTVINHGDLIIAGEAPPLAKVVLTYVVPYCVTTWGAIIGKRAQWRRDSASDQGGAPEGSGSR